MRTMHPLLAAHVLNKLLEGTSMTGIICRGLMRVEPCTWDDGEAIGTFSLHALAQRCTELKHSWASTTPAWRRNTFTTSVIHVYDGSVLH